MSKGAPTANPESPLLAQSGYNVLLLRYLKPDARKLPFQVSSC